MKNRVGVQGSRSAETLDDLSSLHLGNILPSVPLLRFPTTIFISDIQPNLYCTATHRPSAYYKVFRGVLKKDYASVFIISPKAETP